MPPKQRNLPDFTQYGYQAVRRLGTSANGGRSTYLAEKIGYASPFSGEETYLRAQRSSRVIIKIFNISDTETWDGDRAIKREIHLLKKLNYPGIPRYLCDFQMGNQHCLVQEYIDAPDLSVVAVRSAEQVKQIALQLLNILTYIHEENIFHRDIKPENILQDSTGSIYLVDFGIAHPGLDDLSDTSTRNGTYGFVAPESALKNRISAASDIFSLGITLICLLTGTPSEKVITTLWSDEANRAYEIRYRHLLKAVTAPLELTEAFCEWIDTLIQYSPEDRFSSARSAAQALKKIHHLYNVPSIQLLHPMGGAIQLDGVRIGEKLRTTVKIGNTALNTTVRGQWSVKPHPNDVQQWITILDFDSDSDIYCCTLHIDTRRLMRCEAFERIIIFESNAKQHYMEIPLRITTADYLFSKIGFVEVLKILFITLLAAIDSFVLSSFF